MEPKGRIKTINGANVLYIDIIGSKDLRWKDTKDRDVTRKGKFIFNA